MDPLLDMQLTQSVTMDDFAGVKAAIQKGANAKMSLSDGSNLLFAARTLEVSQALVEAGADPKAVNAIGASAVFVRSDKTKECVDYLVQQGADLYAKNIETGQPFLAEPGFRQSLESQGGEENDAAKAIVENVFNDARQGRLPEGFDQWDLKNKDGQDLRTFKNKLDQEQAQDQAPVPATRTMTREERVEQLRQEVREAEAEIEGKDRHAEGMTPDFTPKGYRRTPMEDGTVGYTKGSTAKPDFVEAKGKISVRTKTNESILGALELASQKFSGPIRINGSKAWKEHIVGLAADRGMDLAKTFSAKDPEMKTILQDRIQDQQANHLVKTAVEVSAHSALGGKRSAEVMPDLIDQAGKFQPKGLDKLEVGEKQRFESKLNETKQYVTPGTKESEKLAKGHVVKPWLSRFTDAVKKAAPEVLKGVQKKLDVISGTLAHSIQNHKNAGVIYDQSSQYARNASPITSTHGRQEQPLANRVAEASLTAIKKGVDGASKAIDRVAPKRGRDRGMGR